MGDWVCFSTETLYYMLCPSLSFVKIGRKKKKKTFGGVWGLKIPAVLKHLCLMVEGEVLAVYQPAIRGFSVIAETDTVH